MYGRAPRVTFMTTSASASTVGPGSYDVTLRNSKNTGRSLRYLNIPRLIVAVKHSANVKVLHSDGKTLIQVIICSFQKNDTTFKLNNVHDIQVQVMQFQDEGHNISDGVYELNTLEL